MRVRTRLLTVAACAVTLTVVGVGVGRSSKAPEDPDPPADTTGVSLSAAGLDTLEIAREPFCDDISDESATTAVGGSATETEYTSGERIDLAPGVTDVSHEFGCAFTFGTTMARVWVFAAPVASADAERMVRRATRSRGCTTTGPLEFGEPSAVLLCTEEDNRVLRAVGLIGDSWVHCELISQIARADSSFVVRGQRWCVDAAYAMES